MEAFLDENGFETVRSDFLWTKPEDGALTAELRARDFQKFFLDEAVEAILDTSGGDLANQILPFLDWQAIRTHPKPYFGYSDNSVILNTLMNLCDAPCWLYQPLHLGGHRAEVHRQRFLSILSAEPAFHPSRENALLPPVNFLRGKRLSGEAIGGNLRCTLKLAGTPFWPDFTKKVLLLESWGGEAAEIASALAQWEQTGVFSSISGILLGTFSKMERKKVRPAVEDLVLAITEKYELPVAKAVWFGHEDDAWCVPMGFPLQLDS